VPEKEFEETEQKARSVMRAIEMASGGGAPVAVPVSAEEELAVSK
jgi:hypothetical protein